MDSWCANRAGTAGTGARTPPASVVEKPLSPEVRDAPEPQGVWADRQKGQKGSPKGGWRKSGKGQKEDYWHNGAPSVAWKVRYPTGAIVQIVASN